MPTPKSPTKLVNPCSVVHDNTLYTLTSNTFQSLRLETNATWEIQPTGVKVMGAKCIRSNPRDASQAALFVVGGRADSPYFSGLQKYTFSTKRWTTINLGTKDLHNREGHSATYIKADDAILVYAGYQNGHPSPSSQTFIIKASDPYTIKGHVSDAPPADSPDVLNWSDADACMIGQDGRDIWIINPKDGWRRPGASLASPRKTKASSQLALMSGDDGSKVLYCFDFSKSPTAVERMILQNAYGETIHDSAPVANVRSRDKLPPKTGRRLALDEWPEYNSTFAPQEVRQNTVMAQSEGDLVFLGGPDGDALDMFNSKQNTWVNVDQIFNDDKQHALAAAANSTSSSLISSSTSAVSSNPATTSTSSTVSSSAAASAALDAGNEISGPGPNVILGIVLGSILGFMLLLGLILCLLRRHKRWQNHNRDYGVTDEKDTIMLGHALSPKPVGHFRGHYPQSSHESYSSMAILMRRVGKDRPNLTRKPSNGTNRSSTSSFKKFKSTISKPIPQAASHPVAGQDDSTVAFAPAVAEPRPRNRNIPTETRDSTRRSSGWNRYWSGESALQILGLGPTKRNTGESEQSSHYSADPGHPASHRRDSVTVAPLALEGRPEVNNVVSGSPVVSQFNSKVPSEGITGKIVRSSSCTTSSGYSSGIPESVNDACDSQGTGKARGTDRTLGSAYSSSQHHRAPSMPSSAGAQQPP